MEQAAEHPDAIDQKAAIRGIVAATLGDTAVHSQAVPTGQVVLLSQDQHAIIHPMERPRTHEPFEIVLGGVIGHRVIVDAHPALIGGTIPNGFLGLPIGPFLAAAQEGQAIAGFQRDRRATHP